MQLRQLSKEFLMLMDQHALVDEYGKFVWNKPATVFEQRRVAWAKGYMRTKDLVGIVIADIPLVVPSSWEQIPIEEQIPILEFWGWTDAMLEEGIDVHVIDFLKKQAFPDTRKKKAGNHGFQPPQSHVEAEQTTGAAAPEEHVQMTTNNENTNNTNNNANKAQPIDINFKNDTNGVITGMSVDANQIRPLLKEYAPPSIAARLGEKAAVMVLGGVVVVGVAAGLSYILGDSTVPSAASGAAADFTC